MGAQVKHVGTESCLCCLLVKIWERDIISLPHSALHVNWLRIVQGLQVGG